MGSRVTNKVRKVPLVSGTDSGSRSWLRNSVALCDQTSTRHKGRFWELALMNNWKMVEME